MKKILSLLLFLVLLSACQEEQEKTQTNNNSQPEKAQPEKAEQISKNTISAHNENFTVLSIVESRYENAPAIQINFTLPVDNTQKLKEHIQVSTPKDISTPSEWIINKNGLSLFLPFIEPDQNYRIEVSNKLTSKSGQLLNAPYSKNIKTGRKQKSVRFLSKGNVLLKDQLNLPVEAVNVESIELKFWRLKQNQLGEFLSQPNRSEIYSLQSLNKMADLVYTTNHQISQKKNKTEVHNIPLKDIDPLTQSGIYFVTMLPADSYDYQYENTWFTITDIGLHTRTLKNSIAVFTHKLPDAAVYPNVKLTAYNRSGNVIESTQTDQHGFAQLTDNEIRHTNYLVATHGNNSNLINFSKPMMDLSDFKLSSRPQHPQELFLYSARDLYRPGEKITVNGLLRNYDGQMIGKKFNIDDMLSDNNQATVNMPIQVEIKRPDNRTHKTLNWSGDDSAFYTTDFTIPQDAPTGTWLFSAQLPNKAKFNYVFSVEDFLPERLSLLLKHQDKQHIGSSETPQILVQSDYLYGAPASGNRLDATVTIAAQNRLSENHSDYIFGSNHYRDYDQNFNTEAQLLNDNGSAKMVIPSNWEKTQFPLRIKSHVNVYESGGRPISRQITHNIWPYPLAIGVKPLWGGKLALPNQNNDIELIAINTDQQAVDANNVEVLLIRENNERYWHWGDDGWRYGNSENQTPVYITQVNLSATGNNTLKLPVDYGYYRIEIRDDQRQLLSSYRFFAGWEWQDETLAEKPDQVKLAWNKNTLKPGETAQLNITAPYTGSAIITVESKEILWHKNITLSQPVATVDIPVGNHWNKHNLHATVMVIADPDMKRPNLSARSLGIIHLPMDRSERVLDMQLSHIPKSLPDQPVTIQVKADNIDSKKTTYLTLAAVDTGVLNISNFVTPNPAEWFFAKRMYISELRDMYGALIEPVDGKKTRQKFGGDAELKRGGEAPATDVQIVSITTQKIAFDENGQAQVELPLPYFNGEIRLMAVAFNDQQFGSAESTLKVAAPVVVEAFTPRFMAYGDNSHINIDIHNTENTDNTLVLKAYTDSPLGQQEINQDITLKADEKTTLKLPVSGNKHNGTGTVFFEALVEGQNKYQFKRDWQLGLRPAYPATSKHTEVAIQPGKTYQHQNTQAFHTANLKSILTITDTPLLQAERYLGKLLNYPYGCLEQTSSRAWPLLLVEKEDLKIFNTEKALKTFENRQQLIEKAISKIISMQRYNGSFGLWSNESSEEKWLTVYVTDFLIQAKNNGYNIPNNILENSISRLQDYVRRKQSIRSDMSQHIHSSNHYQFSYRNYAAKVLASIKRINLQDIRKLHDAIPQPAKIDSPLPYAHLATAMELLGDEKRARELWKRANNFQWNREQYAYYGDYGSKTRDLSWTVLLGNQSQINNRSPNNSQGFINDIKNTLKQRQWLSTQEQAILFKTDKSIKNRAKQTTNWTADLIKDGQTDPLNQTNQYLTVWYEDFAESDFSLRNTHTDTLYLTVTTQGYPIEQSEQDDGISISKKYYDLNGQSLDLKNLHSGDKILVHIELTSDQKNNFLPDVLLVDLIPAGFELENQNLEHAMKLDDIKIDGKMIQEWMKNTDTKHSEYRDDRYVAAISLNSHQKSHLFYLATAVTPGKYTVPPALAEDMYRPEIRGVSKKLGITQITAKKTK